MYIFKKNTKIGEISLVEKNGKITNLYFENSIIPKNIKVKESGIIKKAFYELEEYFNGERKIFTVDIYYNLSSFRNSVLKELINIPYGETRSYKEIAIKINNPKGSRAVGMANNKNPLAIFIPCHRVIASNGSLLGYAGGLEVKEKLLNLEKKIK